MYIYVYICIYIYIYIYNAAQVRPHRHRHVDVDVLPRELPADGNHQRSLNALSLGAFVSEPPEPLPHMPRPRVATGNERKLSDRLCAWRADPTDARACARRTAGRMRAIESTHDAPRIHQKGNGSGKGSALRPRGPSVGRFVRSFGCLFREPSVNGRAVCGDPHPRGGYNRAIFGL